MIITCLVLLHHLHCANLTFCESLEKSTCGWGYQILFRMQWFCLFYVCEYILRVCTATRNNITMRKNWGQTVDNAVIDLGKSEATAGLTLFVCISRVKRLRYHLVEPMPFDRLSKLGKKAILKVRLEEEVRLKTVAVETFLRHGV